MKQKLVLIIVMLVAVLFISIPLMSIVKSVNLKKHGIHTEGTVTDVSSRSKGGYSRVTVSFSTSDGNQVTTTASTRKRLSAHERVTIYYDPAAPQKIDFNDGIGYRMRGVVTGGFIFILVVYFFIKYSLTDNANRKLIREGRKIAAEFVSIDRDERFRAGDRNPWIIKCKWVDISTNKEYFFASKTYTIDPAPYLNGRSHVDVFIDPVNPEKYFMDTSFMPEGNNTIG